MHWFFVRLPPTAHNPVISWTHTWHFTVDNSTYCKGLYVELTNSVGGPSIYETTDCRLRHALWYFIPKCYLLATRYIVPLKQLIHYERWNSMRISPRLHDNIKTYTYTYSCLCWIQHTTRPSSNTFIDGPTTLPQTRLLMAHSLFIKHDYWSPTKPTSTRTIDSS